MKPKAIRNHAPTHISDSDLDHSFIFRVDIVGNYRSVEKLKRSKHGRVEGLAPENVFQARPPFLRTGVFRSQELKKKILARVRVKMP